MPKPRDNQRVKIYAWEKSTFAPLEGPDAKDLSLEMCREMIAEIATYYGLPGMPLQVSDGRGRSRACWSKSTGTIKLPRWARRRYVVLHETAHMLCSWYSPLMSHNWDNKEAAHGPLFVRVFIDLLDVFGHYGLKKSELLKSARASRLSIGSAELCAPPARSVVKNLARLNTEIDDLTYKLSALRRERDDLRRIILRTESPKVRSSAAWAEEIPGVL